MSLARIYRTGESSGVFPLLHSSSRFSRPSSVCRLAKPSGTEIAGHQTDEMDVPLQNQTCVKAGAKLGDVAAVVGCRKILELCRGVEKPLSTEKGWNMALTVVPACFSDHTQECYDSAVDWAIQNDECFDVLATDNARCSKTQSRKLFGGAVSRVCGEEVRDGEDFGFWS